MSRKNVSKRPIIGFVSMIALAAAASGCTSTEDVVTPNVEVIDRSTQALSVGVLEWVNGTYGAGCTNRAGAWSARISGVAAMTNTALTVITNDVGCVLTMTELYGAATYVATPSIAMGTAYAGTASEMAVAAQPLAFYANAKLSSVAFAADFALTILFSDNLADASSSTSASYSSVSSASNAEVQVPAPDYTVAFGSFVLQTDVDQVVTTASGTVTLTENAQDGEFYVVDANQSLGATFDDIDTAYAAGTPAAVGASIPAASFTLVGETLPTVRNVIVLHAVSGVKTYQVIRITFGVAS